MTKNIENAKAYLLENKEELRQIVGELNSWDGSLNNLSVQEFDEDFFDNNFSSPYEAARATHFGEVNWSDEYIRYNGYGNLESLSEYDLEQEMVESIDEIMEAILENRTDIDLPNDLEDLLDDEEDEEDEDEE